MDDTAKINPPLLGVSDGTPRIDQPGRVTVPDGLRNVVPEDAPTGIGRLATRAGLASEFAGAWNTGPVQAIGSIARASGVSGTTVDNIDTDSSGESRPAGAFRGQAVVVETDGSIRAVIRDTRGTGYAVSNPPTAFGGWGGFYNAVNPSDPDIVYSATIARDTAASNQDVVVVGITRYSLATNAVTHQTYAMDTGTAYAAGSYPAMPGSGQRDLFPNKLLCYGAYLFVAVNKYVYCFRADTLAYISRYSVPHAEEVQAVCGITVGLEDFLLILSTGNFTETGPVVADSGGGVTERFGEFSRCNILKARIEYTSLANHTPVASGAAVLTQLYMPQGSQSGDGAYEEHATFRFAEWSITRPRGCLAYSMAAEVTADGTIAAYVARTNQGFGYDGNQADQKPDGQSPFITCCKVILTRAFEVGAPTYMSPSSPVRYGMSPEVGGWERDSGQSLRRAFTHNAATYQNDIPAISGGIRNPNDTDNEPSVWAVALDTTNRRVFFCGRRPSLSGAGANVYCMDADNGDLLWYRDTKGTIQQNAAAVDPTTGNLIIGMVRTTGWETTDGGTSPDKAEAITFDGASGAIVRAFDLTDGITFNGYLTASTSGVGVYAVDVNTRGQVLLSLNPHRYDT